MKETPVLTTERLMRFYNFYLMKTWFLKVKDFFLKHRRIEDALVSLVVAFLVTLFFSTSLSPLYPATNCDFINLDSNFFLYSASLLLKGEPPYLVVYDHKGLYHLAVDCLGLLIGGGSRYGVWLLEIFADATTVYFILQSIRLITDGSFRLRLFAVLMYFPLTAMAGSGNMEGEWMLPYVSIALYCYLLAIVKGNDRWMIAGSFMAGLEVGLALNSRPLDAIWGGSCAVYCLVYSVKHRKGKTLALSALLAMVGCAIPFAIIIPLALHGGYLSAMFGAIYQQSFNYIARTETESEGALTTWLNRLLMCTLAVAALVFFLREKKHETAKKDLNLFFLLVALITDALLFVVAKYTNYYWAGYSFFILSLAYYLSTFKAFKPSNQWDIVKSFSSLFALWAFVWATVLVTCYYGSGFWTFSYSRSMELNDFIVNTIPEEERETKGKVFALDCDAAVYIDGGIVVDAPFYYCQSWWSQDNADVLPAVKAYLLSSKPEWLIVSDAEETQDNFGNILSLDYQIYRSSATLDIAIYQAK